MLTGSGAFGMASEEGKEKVLRNVTLRFLSFLKVTSIVTSQKDVVPAHPRFSGGKDATGHLVWIAVAGAQHDPISEGHLELESRGREAEFKIELDGIAMTGTHASSYNLSALWNSRS